jgi:hypothetical protein
VKRVRTPQFVRPVGTSLKTGLFFKRVFGRKQSVAEERKEEGRQGEVQVHALSCRYF